MTYYLTAPKNVYMLNHIFNYRMEILAKMNQDIRFWSWKVFLRDPEEISPPLPLLIQNLNPLLNPLPRKGPFRLHSISFKKIWYFCHVTVYSERLLVYGSLCHHSPQLSRSGMGNLLEGSWYCLMWLQMTISQ